MNLQPLIFRSRVQGSTFWPMAKTSPFRVPKCFSFISGFVYLLQVLMPQTYCSSFKETCTLKTQNLIPQKQKEKIHQHVHPASVTDACFRILDKKVSVIQPHRAYERKKKKRRRILGSCWENGIIDLLPASH